MIFTQGLFSMAKACPEGKTCLRKHRVQPKNSTKLTLRPPPSLPP